VGKSVPGQGLGVRPLRASVGYAVKGITDLVDDTKLNLGLGKNSVNGLRKPGKPVFTGN